MPQLDPTSNISLFGFTILDIVVVLIIIISIYFGYKKGFIHTIFNLVSLFLSLFLVRIFYPVLSRILINTPLYYNLKNHIIRRMELSYTIESATSATQSEIIYNLPIPRQLATLINQNSNMGIDTVLDTSSMEQYIGSILAGVTINIISCIVVFIIVSIFIKTISKSLNIIVKLPIIRTFNRSLGAVVGIVNGVFFVWIGLVVYTALFVGSGSENLIYSSPIALFFYQTNFLLTAIFSIFMG